MERSPEPRIRRQTNLPMPGGGGPCRAVTGGDRDPSRRSNRSHRGREGTDGLSFGWPEVDGFTYGVRWLPPVTPVGWSSARSRSVRSLRSSSRVRLLTGHRERPQAKSEDSDRIPSPAECLGPATDPVLRPPSRTGMRSLWRRGSSIARRGGRRAGRYGPNLRQRRPPGKMEPRRSERLCGRPRPRLL